MGSKSLSKFGIKEKRPRKTGSFFEKHWKPQPETRGDYAVLKDMDKRERWTFEEMLNEIYKPRYKDGKGEKVRDSRMKIAGSVLSKAK